jgi:hypothetical protein
MRIFATPSVIYFVSVLLIASVMLIPVMTPEWLAGIAFVFGGIGTIRAARIAIRLAESARKNSDFTLADWLSGVMGPVVGYGLLVLAAILLAITRWTAAQAVILLATVVLLLSAIGNTWSLVMWIVDQGAP